MRITLKIVSEAKCISETHQIPIVLTKIKIQLKELKRIMEEPLCEQVGGAVM